MWGRPLLTTPRALLATRSLYEISDLDRDLWTIVGMDFSRGTASEQVVICAMDRATGLDADPETGTST